MPIARRAALAEPLRIATSGRASMANARTGPATTLAAASGALIPRNCDISSPKTIENSVTRTSASVVATEVAARVREAQA